MNILIHSSGRPHAQITSRQLTENGIYHVILVQEHEYAQYEAANPGTDLRALPPDISSLSPTRQWIIDAYDGKVVMMDDDLTFFKRRTDETDKFRPLRYGELQAMLDKMSRALDGYAHVGVLAREGAHRCEDPEYKVIGRMMCVLGYNTETVRRVGARFDRIPTKQDFDMTLQLLRKGLPNAILTQWCHNQPGSNTPGGCSRYRTPEMMVASANRLRDLHPKYVKVVQKETKGSWGGGARTDVVISWKKAYEQA